MADIVTNSKARRDYHILETYEAGIVLRGTEVKALRAGKGQIGDAFARVEGNQVFLHNKSEIRKLFSLASVKGNALVPLSLYWKNGKVKVALGVGKGKAQYDKREDLKKKESDREVKRAQMQRFKGK